MTKFQNGIVMKMMKTYSNLRPSRFVAGENTLSPLRRGVTFNLAMGVTGCQFQI